MFVLILFWVICLRVHPFCNLCFFLFACISKYTGEVDRYETPGSGCSTCFFAKALFSFGNALLPLGPFIIRILSASASSASFIYHNIDCLCICSRVSVSIVLFGTGIDKVRLCCCLAPPPPLCVLYLSTDSSYPLLSPNWFWIAYRALVNLLLRGTMPCF